jgi:3-oxoacyl-[acyl-carrier protein] reductase
MDLVIRGRKALLCGASRGLGKAAAMAVAKEGVDVTIVARRSDVL